MRNQLTAEGVVVEITGSSHRLVGKRPGTDFPGE